MKKIVKVIAVISCVGATIGGIILFVDRRCKNHYILLKREVLV